MQCGHSPTTSSFRLAHPTRKLLYMLLVALPSDGCIFIPGRGQGKSRDRDWNRVANCEGTGKLGAAVDSDRELMLTDDGAQRVGGHKNEEGSEDMVDESQKR